MLEESVIYQDIFRKGRQRGVQEGIQRGMQQGVKQGVQQGAEQEVRKVAIRQLERRFGKLSRKAQQEIGQFGVERLEALCDALLDFESKDDLTRWLKQQAG